MHHKDTQLLKINNADQKEHNAYAERLPIYQNASFLYASDLKEGEHVYSRKSNPNRTNLEMKLASLDHAEHAFALSSGTSAVSAVLSLLPANAHLIVSENLYSGSMILIEQLIMQYHLEVSIIPHNQTSDTPFIISKLKPQTKLILIESPSNPTQEVADIKALALVTKKRQILLAVDNSLLSSYYQQPLDLGADIAIQSAAKHLSGHNDLMAGVISVNDQTLYQKLKKIIQVYGLGLTAFDSWLLSRSLDTLGVRIRQQQQSASFIAQWLTNYPLIKTVYYQNNSSVIAFSFENCALTKQWIQSARDFFNICRNFGSVQSSLNIPALMSHKETFEKCTEQNMPFPFDPNLIRLSIGLEAVEDIQAAIINAFNATLEQNKQYDLLK